MSIRETRDGTAIHAVAVLVPALASLPAAYMVGRSTYYWVVLEWFKTHIEFWPWLGATVAVIAALVVEGLGVVSLFLWSSFDRWNRVKATRLDEETGKRILKRGYDEAPARLALVCFVGYVLAVSVLLVVLEWRSNLSPFAPVLFPLLTAVGAMCWSMYEQHRDRLAYHGLAWNYAAKVVEERPEPVSEPEPEIEHAEPELEYVPELGEMDRMILETWTEQPGWSLKRVGEEIGTSTSTVHRREKELAHMGLLSRTSQGMSVNWNGRGKA